MLICIVAISATMIGYILQTMSYSKPSSMLVYLAGVEGSCHHGMTPILEKYMTANNYTLLTFPEPCGGNHSVLKIKVSGAYKFAVACNDSTKSWLYPISTRLDDSQKLAAYINNYSFPMMITPFRHQLCDFIDSSHPIESVNIILEKIKEEKHPISLVDIFEQNRRWKLKIFWLQRDFMSMVWSRHLFNGMRLDGNIKAHAIIIAAFELYILEELSAISAIDPSIVAVLNVDTFKTRKGREKGMEVIRQTIPLQNECFNCFDSWVHPSRNVRDHISETQFALFKKLDNYIKSRKRNIHFLN